VRQCGYVDRRTSMVPRRWPTFMEIGARPVMETLRGAQYWTGLLFGISERAQVLIVHLLLIVHLPRRLSLLGVGLHLAGVDVHAVAEREREDDHVRRERQQHHDQPGHVGDRAVRTGQLERHAAVR
jgi:hypothetical protein